MDQKNQEFENKDENKGEEEDWGHLQILMVQTQQ